MKDFTNQPLNFGHFSSKGNQLKWRDGDDWYKADYLGYEALSEYVVSELLKKSNAHAVAYELVPIKYEKKAFVGCRSKNFLPPNQELITLQKLYQIYQNASLSEVMAGMDVEDRIRHVVDFVTETTGLKGFGQYITSLLEIDALFLNEDRHMNNIAVLFDRQKRTYGYCPIFDNGASLFSDTTMSFPLHQDVYQCLQDIEAKPFSRNFEEQVEAAESMYGVQLKFWFTARDVEEVVAQASVFYDRDVLDRVEQTMREQIRRYSYLQRKAPLENVIKNASASRENNGMNSVFGEKERE